MPTKPRALSLLLLLFLLPFLFPPDSVRADEQLFTDTLQLAEQGDPEAQFSLGLMYDTGGNVERNPEQAVQWFEKAAKAGIGGACLYLGMKYEFGAGVTRNRDKALHWYRQAAVQGWPQAAFLLGSLYLDPPTPNQVRGCAWLNIATEQGYPGADLVRRQECSELNETASQKTTKLSRELRDLIYPNESIPTAE